MDYVKKEAFTREYELLVELSNDYRETVEELEEELLALSTVEGKTTLKYQNKLGQLYMVRTLIDHLDEKIRDLPVKIGKEDVVFAVSKIMLN